MGENMSLKEFLTLLSDCSGDEAIELVSRFQSGALLIESISAESLSGD